MPTDPEEQRRNKEQYLVPYQFKPGQSGNPGGRPKGRSLTAILRAALDGDELNGAKSKDGKSVGEKLVEAMIMHAIDGNPALIKEVFERIEGKVPSKVEPESTVIEVVRVAKGVDGKPARTAPQPGEGEG